jgi:hypothetical protein
MTSIISILVIMQLFTIPIEVGEYDKAVQYWLTRSFKGEPGLFFFSTVVTHIFASFLLFGTVPVMISLLGDTLKRSVTNYERFISVAISRGYVLTVLWAPGAINLLLVTQATGVRWIEIFIPGLVLSLIGVVTSFVLESKLMLAANLKPGCQSGNECTLSEAAACSKACHIIAVVLSLIVLTMIFEKLNFGSVSSRIMLAGAIVVLGWTTVFVRQPDFKANLINYWQNGLLKAVDLAPLFIAMGIFSMAVQKSGLLTQIQPDLQMIANTMGITAIVVVPVLMIICAVVGIHPFISIVMFGQILTALQLPIAPVSLALCLALGGTISYIVSPFAGVILTLAKFLNCRTIDIALHWNWVFSLLFFTEGIFFAYLWGSMFG